jgi:hypothetical protein
VEADCEAERTASFNDLVDVTKRLLKLYGKGPTRCVRPRRRQSQAASARLNPDEMERMDTVSVCLAKLAAMRSDVRRFRSEVLGDERLTPEQACGFLGSPALAVLIPAQLKSYGIPPVGHTATPVPHHGSWPSLLLPESVQQVDIGVIRGVDRRRELRYVVTLFVDPPAVTVQAMSDPGVPSKFLIFVDEGRLKKAPTWPGALLDELRKLGTELEKDYHWPQGAGPWFVLTGDVPPVSPFRTSGSFCVADHMYGTITLHIEPWISAETVLKAYRAIQRDVLRHDNRPLNRRTLALLRFVMDRSTNDGQLPRWRTLVEEWNAAHCSEDTAWMYRGPDGAQDIRRFARDFHRAYQAVLRPRYHC